MPTAERDRLVVAEGSLNLRDLGGYPTADGRLDDDVQTEEHTAAMREAVIADAVSGGLTAEQVAPLLAADPSYLHAALDEVDVLGGPGRSLAGNGLDARRVERVRDNLLE